MFTREGQSTRIWDVGGKKDGDPYHQNVPTPQTESEARLEAAAPRGQGLT